MFKGNKSISIIVVLICTLKSKEYKFLNDFEDGVYGYSPSSYSKLLSSSNKKPYEKVFEYDRGTATSSKSNTDASLNKQINLDKIEAMNNKNDEGFNYSSGGNRDSGNVSSSNIPYSDNKSTEKSESRITHDEDRQKEYYSTNKHLSDKNVPFGDSESNKSAFDKDFQNNTNSTIANPSFSFSSKKIISDTLQKMTSNIENRKVLPSTVVPHFYDLLVNTKIVDDTFQGSVSILIEVKEDTGIVSLNSQDLNIVKHNIFEVREIDSSKFKKVHNDNIESKDEIDSKDDLSDVKIERKVEDYDLDIDKTGQTLNFNLKNGLFKKDSFFLLNILFDGKISSSMNGYYLSKYMSEGIEKTMYSTHFEATAARLVFPCFDQPDMKSIFKINLIVPKNMVSISNSEIKNESAIQEKIESFAKTTENNDTSKSSSDIISYKSINNVYDILSSASPDNKYVSFHNTPIMSTYLVAWAIGDISYLERISDFTPKITLRVYAPRGQEKNGKFSLDVAHDCIKIFQDYFSIDYPLKKLDMIGIPEFAMGAMENWGMITYRMSSLLYDPLNSTTNTKKLIAETVCHELAHQWFGNLVTMKWWDDLWLNEGFATWAAALGVSKLDSNLIDYDIWSSFIASDMEYGMGTDALVSSHPIKVNVDDPEEIDQIFDGISYSKGASLIRMLEDYVGSEIFRKGLNNYLTKHSYGNATTDDLWKEIGNVANKDIKLMMDLWVTKIGFPVISVEEKDDKVFISQERFLLSHDDQKNTNNNEKEIDDDKNKNKRLKIDDKSDEIIEGLPWFVPLKVNFYESNSNVSQETLPQLYELNSVRNTFDIMKKTNFYKFNHEGTGFYRVLYKDNEEMLLNLLRSNSLSSRDRLNLMNDYFQLSIGSYIKCTIPLIFSQEFKEENNNDVLYSVLGGLGEIKGIFYDDDKNREIIEKLILNLVRERVKNVDIVKGGENMNEMTLNTYIIDGAVSNNDTLAMELLSRIFDEQYQKNSISVHPIFRRSMFISVVKRNREGDFEKLWKLYQDLNADDQKNIVLSSLGSTNEDKNVEFLLNEILSKRIKLQDKIYLFSALSGNLKRRDQVVEWTISNFDKIVDMYKGTGSMIGYVVERVFSNVASDKMYEKVKDFFSSLKNTKSFQRSIDKSLERCSIRNKFRKNNNQLMA